MKFRMSRITSLQSFVISLFVNRKRYCDVCIFCLPRAFFICLDTSWFHIHLVHIPSDCYRFKVLQYIYTLTISFSNILLISRNMSCLRYWTHYGKRCYVWSQSCVYTYFLWNSYFMIFSFSEPEKVSLFMKNVLKWKPHFWTYFYPLILFSFTNACSCYYYIFFSC